MRPGSIPCCTPCPAARGRVRLCLFLPSPHPRRVSTGRTLSLAELLHGLHRHPKGCPCPSVASTHFGGQAAPGLCPTEVLLSPLPVPADRAAAVARGAAQGALQAAGGRAGQAAAAAQHRAGKGHSSWPRISPAGEAEAATLTALLFLRRSSSSPASRRS